MGTREYTTIGVRPQTRDQLRQLKRGGESYEDLFGRMVQQFDPDLEDTVQGNA